MPAQPTKIVRPQIIRLGDIADARSGDKGAGANIGVIAHNPQAYKLIQKYLTSERMAKFFEALHPTKIARFELPNLLALNFVLYEVLDGGGSVSLKIDAQGKTLGQAILELRLEIPAGGDTHG